jgi:zinc D-Ala-D-Ala carboxypeptidase
MNLSRFFTLDELTHSNTAKAEGIANQPTEVEVECLRALCSAVLDPLRDAVGKSIKVNSGYRGPALNKRLKGALKSQHLDGQAADIQSPGMAVLELFKTAIRLGLPYDQIIYEVNGASKWVHVSHRAGANEGEILLAKFGTDGRVTYPKITAQQALEMTEPVTRSGVVAEPTYIETADEPERDLPAARGVEAAEPTPRTARTPARKKAAAKKVAAKKKAPAKKAAAKKTAAKKTAAKKTPARKVARAKKATSRKSAARKSATKRAPAKKAAAAKKAASRTTAAKKSATRRAPAKKAPTRKASTRKAVTPKKAAPRNRAATRAAAKKG